MKWKMFAEVSELGINQAYSDIRTCAAFCISDPVEVTLEEVDYLESDKQTSDPQLAWAWLNHSDNSLNYVCRWIGGVTIAFAVGAREIKLRESRGEGKLIRLRRCE